MKKKYPTLHPSQLNFVLKNYKIKNNKEKPECWKPDNFLLAEDEDLIFETFTNYPTMLIPKKDYYLDLYCCIKDNSFYELLSNVPSNPFNDKFMNENLLRRTSKSAIEADLTFFSSSTGHISPVLDEDCVENDDAYEKVIPPPEFSCDIRSPKTLNEATEEFDIPYRSRVNSENCLEVAAITKRMEATPEVIISSPQPIRPPRQKNQKQKKEKTINTDKKGAEIKTENLKEDNLVVAPERRKNSTFIPKAKETDVEENAESNKPSISGKSCLNVPGISSPVINRNETASPAESVYSIQSERSVTDINFEMLELKSRRSSIDTRVLDHENPTPLQQMIMLRQSGQMFLPDSNLISS